MQVLTAHLTDALVPPSRKKPELDSRVDELLMRCLARDPADRFASADELRAAVEALRDAGPPRRAGQGADPTGPSGAIPRRPGDATGKYGQRAPGEATGPVRVG